jgi:hypothetical protein
MAGQARHSNFSEMIDLLTDPVKHGRDPSEAFTVVIPSLPGYHLSYSHGRGGLSMRPWPIC